VVFVGERQILFPALARRGWNMYVLLAEPGPVCLREKRGASLADHPRAGYTGDPYWTDGLRLVMWLSAEPVGHNQVEAAPWEAVPLR